jgi:hypothetical protein
MLTEPDMQALYIAVQLSVIETELRKIGSPTAANRSALFTLVSGAAQAAARLADDLAQPKRFPVHKAAPCSGAAAAVGGNVIAFRR